MYLFIHFNKKKQYKSYNIYEGKNKIYKAPLY